VLDSDLHAHSLEIPDAIVVVILARRRPPPLPEGGEESRGRSRVAIAAPAGAPPVGKTRARKDHDDE
jgi:hypothetical protein